MGGTIKRKKIHGGWYTRHEKSLKEVTRDLRGKGKNPKYKVGDSVKISGICRVIIISKVEFDVDFGWIYQFETVEEEVALEGEITLIKEG